MQYLDRSQTVFRAARMRRSIASVCLLAAIMSAACGSEDPTGPQAPGPPAPQAPSATGVWLGEMVTTFGALRSITLTLQETGNNIVGSCAIAVPGGDPYYTCTVTGERTGDSIALTLVSDGFAPISFEGDFTAATTIDGLLNGSGWVNTPVVLARE